MRAWFFQHCDLAGKTSFFSLCWRYIRASSCLWTRGEWFYLFTHRFVLTFFFLKFLSIIWGHFQPRRLKMSHFSAEIVPWPDKISAENVRKISDFFLAGTISGQFQRWNCPARGGGGQFQCWNGPDRDIFSPRQGAFSAQGKVRFPVKL